MIGAVLRRWHPSALIAGSLLLAACGGSAPSTPTATPISPPAAAASPVASPAPVSSPVAVASPSPSPSPEAAGETYTIVEGDTLLSISQRFYGDETLWRRIYDANRSVIGDRPDNLRVGTVLRIPPRP